MIPDTNFRQQTIKRKDKKVYYNNVHIFNLALGGVFIVALVIRLIYLEQLKNTPLFENLYTDSQFYDNWANQILRGDWIGKEPFFMGPLYPYFLAVIYTIFGHDFYIPRLIQSIVGSLGCLVIYLIAKEIFGKTVGLISSIIAALYLPFIFHEGMFLIESLSLFINSLIIFVLIKASYGHSSKLIFLGGVLLGISALGRANILFFAPAVLVWMAIIFKKSRDMFPFLSGIFLLGIFLIIFPVTLRNYLVGRDLVLITSNGGLNFYIGNNPKANGYYFPPEGLNIETDPSGKQIAEKTVGKKLKPSEVSSFWSNQALSFIKEEPLSWFKLLLKKIFIFINSYEPPQNENIYFYKKYIGILTLPLFSFGIIVPLGLLGLWFSHREWKNKNILLLYLFIISYIISTIPFFITARYRIPVIPYFVIFAAYASYQLFLRIKVMNTKGLFLPSILLILFTIVVNWFDPNLLAYSEKVNFPKNHYNFGNAYLRKNQLNEAMAEYKKAIEINPDFFEAHRALGNMYVDRCQYDKALAEFEEAARIMPDNSDIHNEMGILYKNQGNLDKALYEYSLALQYNPYNVIIYKNRAHIYFIKKLYDRAIDDCQEAIEIDPKDAEIYRNLGMIYGRIGNYNKVYRSFEKYLGLADYDDPQRDEVKRTMQKIALLLKDKKEPGSQR